MNLRESVARALNPDFYEVMDKYFRQKEYSEVKAEEHKAQSLTHQANLIRADAAILAMFDHLAANVSEGMLRAGSMRTGDQFIEMIEQARKEYKEAKG